MATASGRHEAPDRREARDRRRQLLPGVTARSVVLVVGVLLLQLGFVLSYVGAFHAPQPREIPIAVVAPTGAPAGAAASVARRLDGLPAVDTRVAGSEQAARSLLRDRTVDGALLLGANGRDTLLVASAEGGALSSALTEVVTRADAAQQRSLTVQDAVPASASDARGLSAFYLAVGWVVGGYLVASIIGVSNGSVPAGRRHAMVRLGALAVYAIVSGVGGAVIVGPVLGVFSGHFWSLAGLGALVVLAVGAFTAALQVWTGLVGIGLAILIFVILGNPSAGGAYPAPLLPPLWAAIGPWLPPGAATGAIRGISYFGGAGVGPAALVLAGYVLVGSVATLIGAVRHESLPSAWDDAVPSAEPARV